MANTTSREIRLRSRPVGLPKLGDFEVASVEVPAPSDGEFLVRNIWMSVDPYMRGRMTERASYIAPFAIGAVLEGGCVGQVVASNHPKFQVGDYVQGMQGWREYWLSTGTMVQKLDPSLAPIEAYLGVLGMPGLTGYAGLLKIGELKDGENVFVSAAAGAVGAVVCQIAKAKGCYVVGSAGSQSKCDWLRQQAGIDAAINYKETKNLRRAVAEAFPKGIDVYFENVGGEHLEAALENMNPFGRVALCGLISQYNATTAPAGLQGLFHLLVKRVKIQGFIVTDHGALLKDFLKDMAGWIQAGKMKWQQTVFEGIDKAPEAFVGLFHGENLGKMLVRIGPDPAV